MTKGFLPPSRTRAADPEITRDIARAREAEPYLADLLERVTTYRRTWAKGGVPNRGPAFRLSDQALLDLYACVALTGITEGALVRALVEVGTTAILRASRADNTGQ